MNSMECFISESDDKILLVGEGNFSFSVDFVNYVKKNNKKFFSYHDNKCCIISTCFEPENKITTIASVNANILQEKGIRVEFGVDARCLEQNAFLAAGVHRHPFSRVIFNFPHVGGKMRIERNRQLLRDFLVSASQVVQHDGVVCVSLCAGQGGSTVENGGKTERRWDDSWKAVEAAGEAGMLLTAVLPFPTADVLQNYTSTGYRGLQKGFHLADARVHLFRATTTPLPRPLTNEELNNLLSTSKPHPSTTQESNNLVSTGELTNLLATSPLVNITPIHTHKIKNNPWKNTFSSQSKFLEKCISFTNLSHKLVDGIAVCGSVNDRSYVSNEVDVTFLRCLSLNELTDNFSVAPAECCLKLFTRNAFDVASKTLKKLLGAGDYKSFTRHVDVASKILAGEDCDEFLTVGSDSDVTIHVDRFLDGDWRKLWTNGVACVSPRSYTLDVTFSVKEVWREGKFVEVLWAVAGDFIVDLKLLSVFDFDEGAKSNYCYRIVYRSYELPLFKAKIVEIHNEVVVKAVEYHLGATVV